jgi:hypothetical protein
MRSQTIVGIAIALLVAPPCLAQTDTTQRPKPGVRVTKERPPLPKPTVATPLKKDAVLDTLGRVATGTVELPRDTARAGPTPTTPPVTKAAEQAHATAPPQIVQRTPRRGTGFYLGIGGSLAVPYNEFSRLGYQTSYGFGMPMGWHRLDRRLGVRAFLGYDQAHAHVSRDPKAAPALHHSGPDPKIYTATLDATLRFPLTARATEGVGLSLYTVTGGGAYLFRGFGGLDPLSVVLGVDKYGHSRKNITKWGVNAGGGLEWGFGSSAVFFEARFVNAFTTGSANGTD